MDDINHQKTEQKKRKGIAHGIKRKENYINEHKEKKWKIFTLLIK